MFSFSKNKISNQSQSGFGLVELLVTLGIMVLVLWALANFQVKVFSENAWLESSLSADSEARRGLKRLVAELRGAAQSENGTYALANATADGLTFYADIDADGVREQLRYFVSGSEFRRGVIEPTGNPLTYSAGAEVVTTVVNNLVNPAQAVFTYYDENYTGSEAALTAPINLPVVRLVKVLIMIDADPARPPGPLTFESQVAVRSLKY